MSTAEEYIGDINTVNLSRKEPDKSYTDDEITIKGFMEYGRPYTLNLEVGDKPWSELTPISITFTIRSKQSPTDSANGAGGRYTVNYRISAISVTMWI